MQSISEIEELVKLIAKFPGLGPKSAKRIVLKLINNRDEIMKPLANALAKVYKNISRCNICGALKSNSLGCNNCENNKEKFDELWQNAGIVGLKGHRSVGGYRASMYNALNLDSVKVLVEVMREFKRTV